MRDVTECEYIGPLRSTGHGTDHKEHISSVRIVVSRQRVVA
jgi:hypothetical protein